mmetsp:Transcript_805/g.1914  ORF Transcript_805/g.1914 Transcript_805/m.1914 type:complete len:289 (-) Transcript_805:1498-2364(-)
MGRRRWKAPPVGAVPSSNNFACSWLICTTASRHTSLMSEPVYPSRRSAILVRFTCGSNRFSASVTSRISLRVSRLGRSTRIRRGKRLSTASSKSNGLLVDPITTTRSEPASPLPFVPEFNPSHSLIMVVFTLVRVPWAESSALPSRLDRSESTSSMKMTHGANRLASVNTALAFFSDSPNHLFSTEDASTLRKLAPPSVATALANMVLPVPGGPNSKTPLTASRAIPSLYKWGNLSGYVILCLKSSFTSDKPPIMSYVTPISCGDTTWDTKALSCLSCAKAIISSRLR